MSHKLFPGCIVPQPATTSSKVLQNLIPVPGLWEWGDGSLCPQTNQSLSKHTKVLLLLQLETWLDGEEGMLLDWSQLHFTSIRKFIWASLSAKMMNNQITLFFLNVLFHLKPQLSGWTLDGDRNFSRSSYSRNRWCSKLDDATLVILLHLLWLVPLLCSPASLAAG